MNADKRRAMRAELVRLLRGLEAWREWRIAILERERGRVTQADLDEIVEPGAAFLEAFDAARDGQGRAVVDEVRRWYAHAAGDLGHYVRRGEAAEVRQFLAAFRDQVGFDFHAEAGVLQAAVTRVLARGEIASAQEYDMLRELELDVSQSAVSVDDLADLSVLLRRYEAAGR